MRSLALSLLSVVLASVVSAAEVESYNVNGTFTHGFDTVKYSGALTASRQDADSGYRFYVASVSVQTSAWGSEPYVPRSAAVRVYTYVGGFQVTPNSDGEYPLEDGQLYNCYVYTAHDSIGLISASLRTLKVTFPKEGTYVSGVSDYPVTYVFTDLTTNKVISRVVVPAGQQQNLSFRNDTGGAVLVQGFVEGYSVVGGVVVPTPGESILATSRTIEVGEMRRVNTLAGTSPHYVGQAELADTVRAAGGGVTVGPTVSERLTVGNSTAAATEGTLAAVGNHLATELRTQTAAIVKKLGESGGGGGGSADMTATNAKLDAINTSVGALSDEVDTIGAALLADSVNLNEARAQAVAADAERAGAAAAAVAAAGSAASARPGVGSFVVESLGSNPLEFTFPVLGTWNLDPVTNSNTSALVAWMKAGLAWLVAGLLEWWLWRELKALMQIMAGLPQARGNHLWAGTGGQFTALAAAGTIVGVIASVPTLFWAAADSGLTFDASNNPLSGASGPLGISLYLFYGLLPVGTILIALGTGFIVRRTGVFLLMTISAAVRFVVP